MVFVANDDAYGKTQHFHVSLNRPLLFCFSSANQRVEKQTSVQRSANGALKSLAHTYKTVQKSIKNEEINTQ